MNSPLLFSVGVALLTTGAAVLWAKFLAVDMTGSPEADPIEQHDIQGW